MIANKPIKPWICYTSYPMLTDGKIHPNGRQQRPSKVWRTLSKCETLLLWRSACICMCYIWLRCLIFLLIKSQSYCPSVFVLKPGQHVMINKWRLNAFRKMTFDELPNTDCHAAQRSELVAMLKDEKKFDRAPLCISIAYDWWVKILVIGLLYCTGLDTLPLVLTLPSLVCL